MRRFWSITLWLFWAMPLHAADGTITLVTEDSPPFNMLVNGKIAGAATDKVVEMMARLKQPYTLELLPWARAYQMAQESPDTCVFSTTRTAEREPKFKWVGPLAANSWTLFGMAERELHLTTLEDARRYKIGTYNADVRDSYLRSHGFQVDAAASDALNPRKLMAGRIDLWATGPYEARALLAANGLTAQIVPLLTFNRVELYLACHPATPTSLIDRLNTTLQAMAADGTTDRIDSRYDH